MEVKQQISEDTKKEKFYCKKCRKKIGGHNQYLHDGMCDDCFFGIYFPEEQKEKLIEKLKLSWEKYWKLQSNFLANTEKLENEMNEKLSLGIELEFFHCDGEVVGIGAKSYSEREKFPLIHDSELNKK